MPTGFGYGGPAQLASVGSKSLLLGPVEVIENNTLSGRSNIGGFVFSSGSPSVGTPFIVSRGRPSYVVSSISRSKHDYLLVWSEDQQTACARVDENGVLKDPTGIVLPFKGSDLSTSSPVSASDGEGYLIAGLDAQLKMSAVFLDNAASSRRHASVARVPLAS